MYIFLFVSAFINIAPRRDPLRPRLRVRFTIPDANRNIYIHRSRITHPLEKSPQGLAPPDNSPPDTSPMDI